MRSPIMLSLSLLCACQLPTSPGSPRSDAGPSSTDGGSVACFAASPASIDFGEIETGSTASSFVRITNLSSRFLRLEAPQPGDPFSVEPAPIVGLSPDASTQLQLHFVPTDGLLHFGSLTVRVADGGCPLEIPLRGLGAGTLIVSPEVLDFGAVDPGASKSLQLSFTNTFRSPIVFDPIDLMPISGSSVAPFTLDFPSPLTIAPATVTNVTVTARPSGYYEYEASIRLTGAAAAKTIFLTVAGGAPIGSVAPTVIDVPQMDVTDFIERTVRLRNDALNGFSPRSALQFVQPFLEIRNEDGGLSDEVRPQDFFSPLMPQEEAEVRLMVTPSSLGLHRYRLTFFTNAPSNPELRVDLAVNATTLPSCALQHPSRVQLTAAPAVGSFGMIRFTNTSAVRCVLDSVRLARFSLPVFTIADGGVDQIELQPGGVHDVWISGPDAGADAGVLASALWFHVLGPGSVIESIDIVGP